MAAPPMSAGTTLGEAEVGRALEHALSGPPFTARVDTNGFAELARAWHDGITDGMSLSDGVLLLMAVVAAGLLVAMIIWTLRSLSAPRTDPANRRGGTPLEPAQALELPGDRELWAARAALRSGDHRLAVELAWRSANAALGDANALTPRQWARWAATRLSQGGRRDLTRLLQLHERCCYAGRTVPAEAAEAAVELARRMGTP